MAVPGSSPVDLHSASTIGGSQIWSAGAFLSTTANIDTDSHGVFWTTRITTETNRGTKPNDYVVIHHLGGTLPGNGTQIASQYGSVDNYYIRRRSDNAGAPNGANAWQPWRQLWHDGNLTPSNYVQKSGDVMSGQLTAQRFHGMSASTGVAALSTSVTGDTNSRFYVTTDGILNWGTGSALADTTLSRVSAGNLQINSKLVMTEQGRTVTDCNAVTDPGVWGFNATPTNGPGTNYLAMLVARNIDVGFQLAGGYTSDKLYFRGWYGYGDTAGEWTAWRELIHSGNIGTQTVAAAGTATTATTAASLTTIWQNTPALDLNTMGLGRGNNYNTPSMWTNGPAGVSYGSVYNLGGQSASILSLQLLADVNHNVTNSTKSLYFRTGNNLGFQADWKEIWHTGNLTPSNYAPLASPAHTGDVNAVGFSGSWGATPNVGYRTIMGTGASATWLCYGTSGGVFRGGVQILDAGGAMRLYVGANYMEVAGTLNYNGNTVWHAGNLTAVSATNSDQYMRYAPWHGYSRAGMTNPSIGPRSLLYTAIAAGKPLFFDEEFAVGTNSVGIYNNNANGTVTVVREANADAPNRTGYCMKVAYDGGAAPNPGLGGFVQGYTHRKNAIIVQRFIAKIPVGYTVVNAENSVGTNGAVIWLTATAGTGKWEEYIRLVYCGDSGTFSDGGHVYLTGTGAVTWYLASCNAYEITTPGLLGIVDAQINDVAWSKITSKPTIKSPIYFYFLAMTDKQPVLRIDAPSTIVAVRYFRDNVSAPTGNGTISIRKNGTEIYSITISTAHANQTYIDISTTQTSLVAGDRISAVVTAAGTNVADITVELEINQQVS